MKPGPRATLSPEEKRRRRNQRGRLRMASERLHLTDAGILSAGAMTDPLEEPMRLEQFVAFLSLRLMMEDLRSLTAWLMGDPDPQTGRGACTVPAWLVMS